MIRKLSPDEAVSFDRTRLVELELRLGRLEAEEAVSRTMEEIAVQLARMHRATRTGQIAGLSEAAERIGVAACHLGMQTLERVAEDLARLSRRNDGTALVAVAERLSRVGEASLVALWDIKNVSM